MHLTEDKQRVLINSLVDSRNRLQEETLTVEQLLRRVTGSIAEFVNEVGKRPLKINDFDMAVLAMQDGDLLAFQNVYAKKPDKLRALKKSISLLRSDFFSALEKSRLLYIYRQKK